jgi:ribosome-binding protein aMBF1 (putative translation factor)
LEIFFLLAMRFAMTQATKADPQRRGAKSARPRPEIGTIVKALRAKAKVTSTELADRSGLAISTISKIESGQLLPRLTSRTSSRSG